MAQDRRVLVGPGVSILHPMARPRCARIVDGQADTIPVRPAFGRASTTARTLGHFAPPLGDTARFAIRPERIHLFDAETGRRL